MKRCAIAVFGMIAIASVGSERANPDQCLSEDQLRELRSRVMMSAATLGFELVPFQLKQRDTTASLNLARAALAACHDRRKTDSPSSESCEALQMSVDAASERHATVVAEGVKVRSEMGAKTLAIGKAIREEYPNCGSIDR
jgi:hypothetical protein